MIFLKNILEQRFQNLGIELIDITDEVLEEKDKKATGQTADSLRIDVVVTVDAVEVLLYGSDVINKIEEGRESGEVIISGDDPGLLRWMSARGIDARFRYAVAKSIFDNPLDGVEIISVVIDEVREEFADKALESVIKSFSFSIVKETVI